MSGQEIIQLIQNNLIFAIIAACIIGIGLLIFYRIFYRKRYSYSSNRPKKRVVTAYILLAVYLLFVIAATLINRGVGLDRTINLALFSSYKEAWNNFSVRNWQLIYFNIALFIPLGVLLPFIHSRFKKVGWTMLVAFTLTVLIEGVQYVTNRGILELDDVFNNLLGALIGFGFVKVFLVRSWRLRIIYLLPIVLVLSISIGMYSYYVQKPFGNLAINASTNVNMKNVDVSTTLTFKENRTGAVVYKAPSLTADEAKRKAFQYFEQLNIDTSSLEIIAYPNEAFYRNQGENANSIWIHYLDSSYKIDDYSLFENDYAETDEKTLLNLLEKMNIDVPKAAVFKEKGKGKYQWSINQLEDGNQLIDGTLNVSYYADQTIKSIDQAMVTYTKEADVTLKSEQQAYDELVAGKFNMYDKPKDDIVVNKVKLAFSLDSKGFYQPIYEFNSLIDGRKEIISIQAVD